MNNEYTIPGVSISLFLRCRNNNFYRYTVLIFESIPKQFLSYQSKTMKFLTAFSKLMDLFSLSKKWKFEKKTIIKNLKNFFEILKITTPLAT